MEAPIDKNVQKIISFWNLSIRDFLCQENINRKHNTLLLVRCMDLIKYWTKNGARYDAYSNIFRALALSILNIGLLFDLALQVEMISIIRILFFKME